MTFLYNSAAATCKEMEKPCGHSQEDRNKTVPGCFRAPAMTLRKKQRSDAEVFSNTSLPVVVPLSNASGLLSASGPPSHSLRAQTPKKDPLQPPPHPEPKAVPAGDASRRPEAPPSPRPHLAVGVQLGQREVHALVLLLQLVAPGLPAVQLQLGAVQQGLQLLGVGVQLLVLRLQLMVQEVDSGGVESHRAEARGALPGPVTAVQP